jgi:CRISPR/Cas system-associated exonuclease Cas4 (RecB family)
MRTIRASEIGTYLYCRRAWWFQKEGAPSQNQTELAGGSAFHRQHGRQVLYASLLRLAGMLLLLAAIGLLAVGLTMAGLGR